MAKTVAVIDGNSLMHRAYHAVPPTMITSDGIHTNAVFGFLSMFLKFLDMSKPDAVVCAFDAGKPAFRIAALEQYKAQRPHMDPELKEQFPVIEEILSAMNIPIVKVPGWEGDDILGTIAARDEALGFETLLLTGDKDACQLASNLTSIVSMKKGVTDIAVMGPAEVAEKYGVGPELIPDYLGLMGDSSDNIPGVPGIGAKTATKLLQQFGSMEGIYEHLDQLKGKQLENIRDNQDSAFLSRQVATIMRDVEVGVDLENTVFPSYTSDAVESVFDKYQMHAHVSHILRFIGAEAKPLIHIETDPETLLLDSEAQAFVENALTQHEALSVCVEKVPAQTLFDEDFLGAAFCSGSTAAYLEGEGALRALTAVITDGHVVCENAKQLFHVLYPIDSSEPALVTEQVLLDAQVFDVSLAAYILNSSQGNYSVTDLLKEYAGFEYETMEDVTQHQALSQSAYLISQMAPILKEKISESHNTYAFEEIDIPLVATLAIMERNGAALDVQLLNKLSLFTQGKLTELTQKIYDLAGETFNIDSPKQLGHILFDVLELKPTKKTKGKTGYSTDASVLNELAQIHPLPAYVLQYREMAKIKSTYIDALPPLRAGDGFVHTSFNETVTTTGRLSSSDPNLQNIPVRTEFGKHIRECFVPLRSGDLFVSADYSQIELRLLAHLSQDEHLIEAFRSGADFHSSTAAQVFGVSLDQVTPEMRSRAKAVNFGIVYGQQAYGLSQSLHIPFTEAKDMIDRYFETYPDVRKYLDETVDFAKKNGYAETMYGRRRYIPELRERNVMRQQFGERTAMNHPMQGSAADIIKLAMNQVQRRLVAEDLQAKIMIQVHDELDLSVPQGEVEKVCSLMHEVMENVAELRVPLVVDVQFGKNWAQAH